MSKTLEEAVQERVELKQTTKRLEHEIQSKSNPKTIVNIDSTELDKTDVKLQTLVTDVKFQTLVTDESNKKDSKKKLKRNTHRRCFFESNMCIAINKPV